MVISKLDPSVQGKAIKVSEEEGRLKLKLVSIEVGRRLFVRRGGQCPVSRNLSISPRFLSPGSNHEISKRTVDIQFVHGRIVIRDSW